MRAIAANMLKCLEKCMYVYMQVCKIFKHIEKQTLVYTTAAEKSS